MKSRVNLTIDEGLLSEIKSYAAKKQVSISELVETYFKQLTKPAKRPAFLDMVKNMQVPEDTDKGIDLKHKYFEDNAAKYGF
ncbi:MAG: hypothetical protein EOP43_06950 [Sphingobacteriaceae bacterium]|nr:MAG: hypothetical protein EOP43_06950 [Sphingobacteriaceae bacterium]